MKFKGIIFLILIVASFAGILLIQWSLVNQSLSQAEVIHENKVSNALNNLREDLLKHDIKKQTLSIIGDNPSSEIDVRMYSHMDTIKSTSFRRKIIINGEQIVNDSFGKKIIKLDTFTEIEKITEKLINEILDSTKRKDKLDSTLVHSLLISNLKKENLDTQVQFGIIEEKGSVIVKTDGFNKELVVSRKQLYPKDVIWKPVTIALHWEKENVPWTKKRSFPILLSLLLVLLGVGVYFWVFRSYKKQRRLSEAKTDFINSMSHELKTPLATIGLSVNNLSLINKDKASTEYFEIIKEENLRMQDYINNILQLAVFEKEEFSISLERVDVQELIREICKRINPIVESRGGEISLNLMPEEVFLNLDIEHLGNAITNVLNNAILYTEKEPKLKVETSVLGNFFYLAIEDKGIGILKKDQKEIFNKFYRVQKGNIYKEKGTGIGLSYSKEIVDKHHGEISVKSRIGEGSIFTIKLPIS